MDSGSVNRLVLKDHNRILRMKCKWDGQDWQVFDVSYCECVGPLSVAVLHTTDWQGFEYVKELRNFQFVQMEQQRTNSGWNWLFVPPGEENKDLYVRLGAIRKKYVSCGVRIGCYNFVEIEVVGERDLVMLFPGSNTEIRFRAGERRPHGLVTSL